MTALTCYNRSQNAKPSPLRDYCWGFEDVSDRDRLMKVMASQAANRVGSYKVYT